MNFGVGICWIYMNLLKLYSKFCVKLTLYNTKIFNFYQNVKGVCDPMQVASQANVLVHTTESQNITCNAHEEVF